MKIHKVRKLPKRSSHILLPKDYSLTVDGVTQSIIGNYCSCRQKCVFSLNRWYDPKSEKRMDFGNLTHGCLDKMYKRGNKPNDRIIDKWVE